MAECPDCYCTDTGILDVMMDSPCGDGQCDNCGGTGDGSLADQFAASLAGEEAECLKCSGTGQCQTCGGTGTVND